MSLKQKTKNCLSLCPVGQEVLRLPSRNMPSQSASLGKRHYLYSLSSCPRPLFSHQYLIGTKVMIKRVLKQTSKEPSDTNNTGKHSCFLTLTHPAVSGRSASPNKASSVWRPSLARRLLALWNTTLFTERVDSWHRPAAPQAAKCWRRAHRVQTRRDKEPCPGLDLGPAHFLPCI